MDGKREHIHLCHLGVVRCVKGVEFWSNRILAAMRCALLPLLLAGTTELVCLVMRVVWLCQQYGVLLMSLPRLLSINQCSGLILLTVRCSSIDLADGFPLSNIVDYPMPRDDRGPGSAGQ